jgi:hypothetical protein
MSLVPNPIITADKIDSIPIDRKIHFRSRTFDNYIRPDVAVMIAIVAITLTFKKMLMNFLF